MPRGSKISMRYTYDNSSDNVRNPFQPPRRVKAGDESTDEMATLTLQVLTTDVREKMVLFGALSRRRLEQNVNARWVARYNLGVTLQQQGRREEAIAQFRQALQDRPDFLHALGNLGLALVDQGEIDEGIGYYRQALRLHPDAVEINFNLGVALIRRGELGLAIDHLSHAARVMPDSAKTQYQLGIAQNRIGDAARALEHLREAARLEPDWPAPARGIEVLLSHHPELR